MPNIDKFSIQKVSGVKTLDIQVEPSGDEPNYDVEFEFSDVTVRFKESHSFRSNIHVAIDRITNNFHLSYTTNGIYNSTIVKINLYVNGALTDAKIINV